MGGRVIPTDECSGFFCCYYESVTHDCYACHLYEREEEWSH